MAKEPEIIDADELQKKQEDMVSEEKSIVLAKDVLPDMLPIIPLFDRPLFPKMMAPVIIQNEKIIQAIIEGKQNDLPKERGQNNFHKLAPGFRLDLFDLIAKNRRNSELFRGFFD